MPILCRLWSSTTLLSPGRLPVAALGGCILGVVVTLFAGGAASSRSVIGLKRLPLPSGDGGERLVACSSAAPSVCRAAAHVVVVARTCILCRSALPLLLHNGRALHLRWTTPLLKPLLLQLAPRCVAALRVGDVAFVGDTLLSGLLV